MPDQLRQIETELRQAVASQRHNDVQQLITAYCQAAERHVRSMPPGDPRIPEAAVAIFDVLQWTRSMLSSTRESIASELQKLPSIQKYLQAPPPSKAAGFEG